MLYRNEVPLEVIAKTFGHANVEVTKAHYAFPSEEQILNVSRKQKDAIPEAEGNLKGDSDDHKREGQIYPENYDDLKKILGF